MKRGIFLLILITFLAYFNSFDNGFVWDDFNNIVNNRHLEQPVELKDVFLSLPTPPAQFYRPIPFLTIAFDYKLWKDNPVGYHLTNSLFHLFNVIIIFYITTLLVNSYYICLICAILFAVHPIHTEAITYISGRSEPICVFFLLTSFYFYLRYLNTVKLKGLAFLIISLILFLMGLFSKELALVFPLLIFSYNICFLKDSLRFKRTAPFILLGLSFLLFRYSFVRWQSMELFFSRLYLFPKILLFYLRLLILPLNLHMQHSFQEIKIPFILSVLIFLVFLAIFLKYIRRKTIMIFGLSWFLIGLIPFLGIFKFNADMAEHWLYLASFGFFLMAAQLQLWRNKIVLSSLVIFFSVLTIQRNFIWRDDISIYQDTLKYRPDDYKLHYNLGNAYLRRNLLVEAYKEYAIAIKIYPNHTYALHNLGIVFNLIDYAFAEEEAHFDHSLYAEVLDKFVKDGMVDYVGLKSKPYLLNAYLEKVSKLDKQTFDYFSKEEKLALYLNVYNAFTLKLILEHYPLKSIRDIPGVWDRFKLKIAGREFSLNQIEHGILRKEFKEPRIHFALVCASKSCPKLVSEPFNAKDLDKQLDKETYKFINDKTKVRLDKENRILYLSSIFKWFGRDFGDIIEFVIKYLPKDDRQFIEKEKPSIKYLKYDWSLNE